MSTANVDRAEEIAHEIGAHLTANGIDGATATTDLLEVPAALANGPVILVNPPKLKFPTWDSTNAEWELFVIAGPYADRLAAWRKLDPIIAALKDPFSLDGAEPANFQHPSMPDYPAYVLSFTEMI